MIKNKYSQKRRRDWMRVHHPVMKRQKIKRNKEKIQKHNFLKKIINKKNHNKILKIITHSMLTCWRLGAIHRVNQKPLLSLKKFEKTKKRMNSYQQKKINRKRKNKVKRQVNQPKRRKADQEDSRHHQRIINMYSIMSEI